jgi:hypothetical protein
VIEIVIGAGVLIWRFELRISMSASVSKFSGILFLTMMLPLLLLLM